MKIFDLFSKKMEKWLTPLMNVLSNNKTIKVIQAGVMCTMPITLGASLITVIANLPIKAWSELLTKYQILATANELVSATFNMIAIYLVVTVGYNYAANEKENGIICAILSLASFIVLMPQTISIQEETISALASNYLGAEGYFIALVNGIVISKLYCFLMKKNIRLKMPDGVPPMVSDSLSPTFVAMIIFSCVFVVKYLFVISPYGNIFNFTTVFISKPIMALAANEWAFILVFTFSNLLFFFGIHPSAMLSVYIPVLTAALIANIYAFMAGEPMPYLTIGILMITARNSGTGNTLGLSICTFFSKSKRYKAMSKIMFIPNLFNINEPVFYGMPVMLNPIFFIPLMLSTIIPALITMLFVNIFDFASIFKPIMSTPWVTPTIITGFMKGGIPLLVLVCICILSSFLLYYPFFKLADNKAYEEEQLLKGDQNNE